MPTLTNGGLLLPILIVVAALVWAGMHRMVARLGRDLDGER